MLHNSSAINDQEKAFDWYNMTAGCACMDKIKFRSFTDTERKERWHCHLLFSDRTSNTLKQKPHSKDWTIDWNSKSWGRVEISAQRAEVETELGQQDKLVRTEQKSVQATTYKKELKSESAFIKKDIVGVTMVIQKWEQIKINRENKIKSLNNKIINQDEVIMNKKKNP